MLLQHRSHQLLGARPRVGEPAPVSIPLLCEPHDIIDAACVLSEQASDSIVGGGNEARQQLEEHHSHAEDVAARIPYAIPPSLRRDVARSSLHSGIISAEALCQSKVNEHNLGVLEAVVELHHDIRLFDVAVHDGVAMQEGEAVETLSKYRAPPLLIHVNFPSGMVTYLAQVSTKVWLVDNVEMAVVLEDLKRLGNVLIVKSVHQHKLLLQLFYATCIGIRLGVELDAVVVGSAVELLGKVHHALPSPPKLLLHQVASIFHRLNLRDPHIFNRFSREFLVLVFQPHSEHLLHLVLV
mmetsp:Transcript_52280/g.124706  ORF Transcript_52280/g.124706 Transcript_52280/m.124706 type:complete len:296 (-) Transcript_52280:413-1300(-)